ncbi:hypothetical protein RvY_12731 [Ramazzottius varieornatus]|uniref:Uncharacterized protein n=1 Tax=Ramazzottius varieornatus TaxID=947166 RepID=A0A1D1VU60_RAMVA|nr:hypothetical protein RvY_12731 [Ramazzottius varieornatus]
MAQHPAKFRITGLRCRRCVLLGEVDRYGA